MVKKRIEEDSKRLEAIKSVGTLMSEKNLDIEDFKIENHDSLLKNLVSIKEKPLSRLEIELIEEILSINT